MVINVHTDLHCEHILLFLKFNVVYWHVLCMGACIHVMPLVWHCLYKINGTDALYGVCVLWAPLVREETNKEGRFSYCGKGTKHIFTYM